MFNFLTENSNIFLILGIIVVGFVLIIYGGNFFVDSSVWLAKVSHIPEIIIGATIVSIGTTLPELIVSFLAAGSGENSMAVGNAVGSILCNTALILGLILAFSSAKVSRKDFLPKYIQLVFAVLLIGLFCVNTSLEVWECAILVILFAVFIVYSILDAKKQQKIAVDMLKNENPNKSYESFADNSTSVNYKKDETTVTEEKKKKPALMILLFLLGAAGIAVGAGLLVNSVSALALKADVSQQIISLTVVAIGTSLPELVTALTALKKNNVQISLGNILGADLINATLIVGGSGLIAGTINIPKADIFSLVLTVCLSTAVLIILAVPIIRKQRIYKWQGISMISIYLIYIAIMIMDAVNIF